MIKIQVNPTMTLHIPEEEKDYEYGEIDSVVNYIDSDYYGYDNPLLDEEYPGEFEETYGISKEDYYDHMQY